MTPREFCYWLQGFIELSDGPVTLSKKQIETIQKHLALVFTNVTGTSSPTPTVEFPHAPEAGDLRKWIESVTKCSLGQTDITQRFDTGRDVFC